MKKKAIVITAILLALCLGGALAVSAVDSATTPLTQIVKDKTYYAYYNQKTEKGAVAFCLDNRFVSFGKTQDKISVCTKNENGSFTAVYEIEKSDVNVWFAGTTELKFKTSENVSSLLGGLSGIGLTADSEKTNVELNLESKPLDGNTEYYIYIPAYYFTDENGTQSAACYIPLEKTKTNSYSGNLQADIQNIADGVYDIAVWGLESISGLLGK